MGVNSGFQKVPAGFNHLLTVVVGQPWPEGDVDGLWAIAHAWNHYVKTLQPIVNELRSAASQVQGSMTGTIADQATHTLRTQLPDAIQQLAEQSQELGKQTQNGAADIQKARIEISFMLAILAITIAQLAASLFGSPAIPGVIAAARVGIGALLKELMTKLGEIGAANILKSVALNAAKYAALNAAFMTGLDFVIQGAQQAGGIRDGWDKSSLEHSAIAGAIGGAAFGIVHGLGGQIGKAIDKIDLNALSKLNPKNSGSDYKPVVWSGLEKLAGHGLYVATQAGAFMLAGPLISVATGGPMAFSYAGILGLLGAGIDKASTAATGHDVQWHANNVDGKLVGLAKGAWGGGSGDRGGARAGGGQAGASGPGRNGSGTAGARFNIPRKPVGSGSSRAGQSGQQGGIATASADAGQHTAGQPGGVQAGSGLGSRGGAGVGAGEAGHNQASDLTQQPVTAGGSALGTAFTRHESSQPGDVRTSSGSPGGAGVNAGEVGHNGANRASSVDSSANGRSNLTLSIPDSHANVHDSGGEVSSEASPPVSPLAPGEHGSGPQDFGSQHGPVSPIGEGDQFFAPPERPVTSGGPDLGTSLTTDHASAGVSGLPGGNTRTLGGGDVPQGNTAGFVAHDPVSPTEVPQPLTHDEVEALKQRLKDLAGPGGWVEHSGGDVPISSGAHAAPEVPSDSQHSDLSGFLNGHSPSGSHDDTVQSSQSTTANAGPAGPDPVPPRQLSSPSPSIEPHPSTPTQVPQLHADPQLNASVQPAPVEHGAVAGPSVQQHVADQGITPPAPVQPVAEHPSAPPTSVVDSPTPNTPVPSSDQAPVAPPADHTPAASEPPAAGQSVPTSDSTPSPAATPLGGPGGDNVVPPGVSSNGSRPVESAATNDTSQPPSLPATSSSGDATPHSSAPSSQPPVETAGPSAGANRPVDSSASPADIRTNGTSNSSRQAPMSVPDDRANGPMGDTTAPTGRPASTDHSRNAAPVPPPSVVLGGVHAADHRPVGSGDGPPRNDEPRSGSDGRANEEQNPRPPRRDPDPNPSLGRVRRLVSRDSLRSWRHWVEAKLGGRGFLGGVDDHGRVYRFRPEDVRAHELRDANGKHIGAAFVKEPELIKNLDRWARSTDRHDHYYKVAEGFESLGTETTSGHKVEEPPETLGEALGDGVVQRKKAPWAGSYADHGEGPAFYAAHGHPIGFAVPLRHGTVVRMTPEHYVRLWQTHPASRPLLDGQPGRHVVTLTCQGSHFRSPYSDPVNGERPTIVEDAARHLGASGDFRGPVYGSTKDVQPFAFDDPGGKTGIRGALSVNDGGRYKRIGGDPSDHPIPTSEPSFERAESGLRSWPTRLENVPRSWLARMGAGKWWYRASRNAVVRRLHEWSSSREANRYAQQAAKLRTEAAEGRIRELEAQADQLEERPYAAESRAQEMMTARRVPESQPHQQPRDAGGDEEFAEFTQRLREGISRYYQQSGPSRGDAGGERAGAAVSGESTAGVVGQHGSGQRVDVHANSGSPSGADVSAVGNSHIGIVFTHDHSSLTHDRPSAAENGLSGGERPDGDASRQADPELSATDDVNPVTSVRRSATDGDAPPSSHVLASVPTPRDGGNSDASLRDFLSGVPHVEDSEHASVPERLTHDEQPGAGPTSSITDPRDPWIAVHEQDQSRGVDGVLESGSGGLVRRMHRRGDDGGGRALGVPEVLGLRERSLNQALRELRGRVRELNAERDSVVRRNARRLEDLNREAEPWRRSAEGFEALSRDARRELARFERDVREAKANAVGWRARGDLMVWERRLGLREYPRAMQRVAEAERMLAAALRGLDGRLEELPWVEGRPDGGWARAEEQVRLWQEEVTSGERLVADRRRDVELNDRFAADARAEVGELSVRARGLREEVDRISDQLEDVEDRIVTYTEELGEIRETLAFHDEHEFGTDVRRHGVVSAGGRSVGSVFGSDFGAVVGRVGGVVSRSVRGLGSGLLGVASRLERPRPALDQLGHDEQSGFEPSGDRTGRSEGATDGTHDESGVPMVRRMGRGDRVDETDIRYMSRERLERRANFLRQVIDNLRAEASAARAERDDLPEQITDAQDLSQEAQVDARAAGSALREAQSRLRVLQRPQSNVVGWRARAELERWRGRVGRSRYPEARQKVAEYQRMLDTALRGLDGGLEELPWGGGGRAPEGALARAQAQERLWWMRSLQVDEAVADQQRYVQRARDAADAAGAEAARLAGRVHVLQASYDRLNDSVGRNRERARSYQDERDRIMEELRLRDLGYLPLTRRHGVSGGAGRVVSAGGRSVGSVFGSGGVSARVGGLVSRSVRGLGSGLLGVASRLEQGLWRREARQLEVRAGQLLTQAYRAREKAHQTREQWDPVLAEAREEVRWWASQRPLVDPERELLRLMVDEKEARLEELTRKAERRNQNLIDAADVFDAWGHAVARRAVHGGAAHWTRPGRKPVPAIHYETPRSDAPLVVGEIRGQQVKFPADAVKHWVLNRGTNPDGTARPMAVYYREPDEGHAAFVAGGPRFFWKTPQGKTFEQAVHENRPGARTLAPYAKDYEHDGHGPIVVGVEGEEKLNAVPVIVKAGTRLGDGTILDRDVTAYVGDSFADILAWTKAFRDIWEQNERASLLVTGCYVASGRLAPAWVKALRKSTVLRRGSGSSSITGFREPIHTATGVHVTAVTSIPDKRGGRAAEAGDTAVDDNGTLVTFERRRFLPFLPDRQRRGPSYAARAGVETGPREGPMSASDPLGRGPRVRRHGDHEGRSVPERWIRGVVNGRKVEFRSTDVLDRPVYGPGHGGRLVGFTLVTKKRDHDDFQALVESRQEIDTMRMTAPNESLPAAIHANRQVIGTPWLESYYYGGKGPVLGLVHGLPHAYSVPLKTGTVLHYGNGKTEILSEVTDASVGGKEMGRLLPALKWFQRAWEQNPRGDFGVLSCYGAGPSKELMVELRGNNNFQNEAHFARGKVAFEVDFPKKVAFEGELGVTDNRGWITYDRFSTLARDREETRYPEEVINGSDGKTYRLRGHRDRDVTYSDRASGPISPEAGSDRPRLSNSDSPSGRVRAGKSDLELEVELALARERMAGLRLGRARSDREWEDLRLELGDAREQVREAQGRLEEERGRVGSGRLTSSGRLPWSPSYGSSYSGRDSVSSEQPVRYQPSSRFSAEPAPTGSGVRRHGGPGSGSRYSSDYRRTRGRDDYGPTSLSDRSDQGPSTPNWRSDHGGAGKSDLELEVELALARERMAGLRLGRARSDREWKDLRLELGDAREQVREAQRRLEEERGWVGSGRLTSSGRSPLSPSYGPSYSGRDSVSSERSATRYESDYRPTRGPRGYGPTSLSDRSDQGPSTLNWRSDHGGAGQSKLESELEHAQAQERMALLRLDRARSERERVHWTRELENARLGVRIARLELDQAVHEREDREREDMIRTFGQKLARAQERTARRWLERVPEKLDALGTQLARHMRTVGDEWIRADWEGTTIEFRAGDAFSRPVYNKIDANGVGRVAGASFMPPNADREYSGSGSAFESTNQTLVARPKLDKMYLTMPGEKAGPSAIASAIARGDIVRTPWDGPIIAMDTHGLPDFFGRVMLPAGTRLRSGTVLTIDIQVDVSNKDMAPIVLASKPFQEAYVRNPNAHFVGMVCLVGSGRASREFMSEMRDRGFRNDAHWAGKNFVTFDFVRRDNSEPGLISVEDNGGFVTYGRDSKVPRVRMDTMYSSSEIARIEARERRR